MMDLFYQGGPIFMGILTLLGLLILALAGWHVVRIFIHPPGNPTAAKARIRQIRSVGLLALVTGIFGQLIDLFNAFEAIEALNSVSPAMLAGGLKVSMISTLYGFVIFLLSLLIWLALETYLNRLTV